MLKKSFKFKIFLIFLLPAVALVYFSFYFVSMKYQEMENTSAFMFSAKVTKIISRFIHNLQLERGLSAGYIVSANKDLYRKNLLNQQKLTDKAYKDFLHYVKLSSKDKTKINQITYYKNQQKIKNVLKKLHKLQQVRDSILKSSITFEDEMEYYTYINKQLIEMINTITAIFYNNLENSSDIYILEKLKESAGEERAYIYSSILCKRVCKIKINDIQNLIVEQEQYKSAFMANAPLSDLVLYNQTVSIEVENRVKEFRKRFFDHKLSDKDAKAWFRISTLRINELEKLSIKIIDLYLKKVSKMNAQATTSLAITIILWLLSILSFFFLLYILNKLVNNEAKLVEDLRISSYAFDAHEAMTVTDPNGNIIRVNKAFTKITGYTPEEVVGKNPRVLKSYKHSEEFYKNMWRDLHTKGYWSDDIYNKRKNGEIYLERLSITAIKDKNGITTHYIAQFLDISELKKAQEEAIKQATHDPLTGLPNRKLMMKKLQDEFVRAKRHNFISAFLFIDIDNFKVINDNYGHLIGDKLLINASKRLKTCLREEDYVARISGDEFGVMLLDLNDSYEQSAKYAKQICSKILEKLSKPFFIDEYKLKSSVSIGIKMFPDSTRDIYDVINKADTAMYKAKEKGKNRFVFYDKNLEHRIKEINLLEDEIKEALRDDQFVFFFQPKVDVSSSDIVGAELLIRWQSPIKGMVYPDSFIQVAKDMGVIPEITRMAVKNACEFIEKNRDIFKGSVSINIGSTELAMDTLVGDIERIIKSHDIENSSIELEILEDELIKDFNVIISNINKLKNIGVKFSIDDFGTGYSSIKYLQKLPVNTLKIDRYFMQNIDDKSSQELIKMIIKIAKIFKLSTVVEGVETKSQLDFIINNGATQYQGFYFSKAVSAEEFKRLLVKKG